MSSAKAWWEFSPSPSTSISSWRSSKTRRGDTEADGQGQVVNERVLIVEDDPETRAILARILAGRFRVKTAPDGRAALDLLWEEPVDLVVTDLDMPRMDGRELAAVCARRFPGMPVVVLTANSDLDTAVEAMKAGAWDYALKPVRAEVLMPKLEEALERAKSSFDISLTVAESMAGKSPKLSGVKFGPYTLREAIALGSYARRAPRREGAQG